MNGFATTDELSTKDGQSWISAGTVSHPDVTAFPCVCLHLSVSVFSCMCAKFVCLRMYGFVYMDTHVIAVVPVHL